MKVLQTDSIYGIGITGRISTDGHSILTEQEHESLIANGRDLPKNSNNAIRIGTKVDKYTHVAKTGVLYKYGFGSKCMLHNRIKLVFQLRFLKNGKIKQNVKKILYRTIGMD